MAIPRLWAFLAVALPTVAALIAAISSVDLTYHLRAGAEILDEGAIPAFDSWTFTAAGMPWLDQQWGAQVALSSVYQAAGWTGLAIVRAGLVTCIFGCLFEIGRRHGLGLRQAAWLTLAAFVVSAPALALRPQLGGMALFALTLLLVADRRRHPARLWAIPLIVTLWANVHGSFLLGPLVLGLVWLEDLHGRVERPHTALAIAVVSIASACLTPFGPTVWGYAVGLSINPEVTARISEWQPTSVRDVPGVLFFVSALAVVALIGRRGQSTAWPTLLWLAVFLGIGAYAVRGTAWWSLAAVPLVAALLPLRVGAPSPRTSSILRRFNVGVVAAVLLVGLAALPSWRPVERGTGAPTGLLRDAPPGVTVALQRIALPEDRLFNPQAWGSWFEYAIPDLPVAIDSRIELFPPNVWGVYENIIAGGDQWDEQLKAWGVTIVVVSNDAPALATRLSSARWRSIYADEDGWVLVAPDR